MFIYLCIWCIFSLLYNSMQTVTDSLWLNPISSFIPSRLFGVHRKWWWLKFPPMKLNRPSYIISSRRQGLNRLIIWTCPIPCCHQIQKEEEQKKKNTLFHFMITSGALQANISNPPSYPASLHWYKQSRDASAMTIGCKQVS